MEHENKILNAAIKYISQGWSVIPICSPSAGDRCNHHLNCNAVGKRPIPNTWKEYQSRRATEEEVRAWWAQYPDANVGIITGKISGLVVIDVENGGDMSYPPTVIANTGGGGKHFLYAHSGEEIPNAARIKPLTDIRGDGGLIVAAPSRHRLGGVYEWLIPPDDALLAPFPASLFQNIKGQRNLEEIAQGVSVGKRNDSATVIIGSLLSKYTQSDWETICWPLVQGWNAQNNPPISDGELRRTYDSIAMRELSNKQPVTPVKPWTPSLSFADLVEAEYPEMGYAVDRIVPIGGATLLSGPSGVLKSIMLGHIAISCATGTPVFGYFATQQMNVMVVDEENGKSRLAKRVKALTQEKNLPIHYRINNGFKITDPDQLQNLIKEIKEKNVELVMIDTLVRVHTGDENKSSDMGAVYDSIKVLLNEGLTIIFIHHHKKQGPFKLRASDLVGAGEAMRGSSDILCMADAHLAILELKEDSNGKYLVAVQTKQRDDELLNPFKIRIISNESRDRLSFEHGGQHGEDKKIIADTKEKIIKLLESDESGLCISELVSMVAVSKTSVQIALKELEAEGEIYSKRASTLRKDGIIKEGRGNIIFFFLANKESQEPDDPIFDVPF